MRSSLYQIAGPSISITDHMRPPQRHSRFPQITDSRMSPQYSLRHPAFGSAPSPTSQPPTARGRPTARKITAAAPKNLPSILSRGPPYLTEGTASFCRCMNQLPGPAPMPNSPVGLYSLTRKAPPPLPTPPRTASDYDQERCRAPLPISKRRPYATAFQFDFGSASECPSQSLKTWIADIESLIDHGHIHYYQP